MRKARIFLFLGVWVAILPYLGFPSLWKDLLFTLTGLVVIFMSYALYREYKTREGDENTFDNFRENDGSRLRENIPQSGAEDARSRTYFN